MALKLIFTAWLLDDAGQLVFLLGPSTAMALDRSGSGWVIGTFRLWPYFDRRKLRNDTAGMAATMRISADKAAASSLIALRPFELAWLVAVPTLLNAVACRAAIPWLDACAVFPIEVTYFLCVGLLVLLPMFVGALYLAAREFASPHVPDILTRMRVHRIGWRDWLWTIGTFVALCLASFVIAKIVMPRLGLDATPFFFQNMPLAPEHRWILGAWPAFFFLNIFGEELFWRGYLQPRQELLSGRWTWLVQGLLWAAWHIPMGWDLVFASAPIFFILPAVVQFRQNTSIAIVVHAVFGAFGFLALAEGMVH